MRRTAFWTLVAALAAALTAGSAAAFGGASSQAPPVAAPAVDLDLTPGADAVERLQRRLRDRPRDARSWAALGLAYVERARVTADPAHYPKAEAALRQSLREAPGRNEAALTGLAALAAARHDFRAALWHADRALDVNPLAQRAAAVRVDALVELGRLGAALDQALRADARRPGVPIFTRLAYVHELRGRSGEARRVLELARVSATSREDLAYVAVQLGELAWHGGDAGRADAEFAAALRAVPDSVPALDGRARVRTARGDAAGALRDREAIVKRLPLPSYLASYGELLESQGRTDEAKAQYAVAGAWTRLAKANGVNADLETALFEADHGDRRVALRVARAEWDRRCPGARPGGECGAHVADALAWALHVNGRHAEAREYARGAARTGYRHRTFRRHLGAIEKALGEPS